jgi:hypothetical protein
MKVNIEGVVSVDAIPPQKHVGSHRPQQSMWQTVFDKLDDLLPNQAVVLQHDACYPSEFHARLRWASKYRYGRFQGCLVARVRGDRAYVYLKDAKKSRN